MANILNVNTEKPTYRVCTDTERTTFSEIYRYFETYANLDAVDVNDDKSVKAYLADLSRAGFDIYNSKDRLRVFLVLAVQDYFSEVIKQKQGENNNDAGAEEGGTGE